MKMVLMISVMLLIAPTVIAKSSNRIRMVDIQGLIKKAESLDEYARLSGQEMIKKTNEIHSVIRYLQQSLKNERTHLSLTTKKQILKHISDYHKSEQQKMKSRQTK